MGVRPSLGMGRCWCPPGLAAKRPQTGQKICEKIVYENNQTKYDTMYCTGTPPVLFSGPRQAMVRATKHR